MDTLKQFAENEKKQRIEAEKELHLQVCFVVKKYTNIKTFIVMCT
jgi:hypothetical protein